MAADPDTIIARARACLGVPFRLQGRDRWGLDCVGLIATAYELRESAPRAYRLRGTTEGAAQALLAAHFRARSGLRPEAGDVLLLRSGPAQLHLGLWAGAGMVHAHAGLRRVVETPGLPDGIIGIWYLGER